MGVAIGFAVVLLHVVTAWLGVRVMDERSRSLAAGGIIGFIFGLLGLLCLWVYCLLAGQKKQPGWHRA